MKRMIVNLKDRARTAAVSGRDAGQGMLEYIGILVVAALLIVGVLTVMKGFEAEQKANDQIESIDEAISNARG